MEWLLKGALLGHFPEYLQVKVAILFPQGIGEGVTEFIEP